MENVMQSDYNENYFPQISPLLKVQLSGMKEKQEENPEMMMNRSMESQQPIYNFSDDMEQLSLPHLKQLKTPRKRSILFEDERYEKSEHSPCSKIKMRAVKSLINSKS